MFVNMLKVKGFGYTIFFLAYCLYTMMTEEGRVVDFYVATKNMVTSSGIMGM